MSSEEGNIDSIETELKFYSADLEADQIFSEQLKCTLSLVIHQGIEVPEGVNYQEIIDDPLSVFEFINRDVSDDAKAFVNAWTSVIGLSIYDVVKEQDNSDMYLSLHDLVFASEDPEQVIEWLRVFETFSGQKILSSVRADAVKQIDEMREKSMLALCEHYKKSLERRVRIKVIEGDLIGRFGQFDGSGSLATSIFNILRLHMENSAGFIEAWSSDPVTVPREELISYIAGLGITAREEGWI
jgi:hypothetical protein